MEGNRNPWKDRALMRLATTDWRHGLVSGAKPWRRLLFWGSAESGLWQRRAHRGEGPLERLSGRQMVASAVRSG